MEPAHELTESDWEVLQGLLGPQQEFLYRLRYDEAFIRATTFREQIGIACTILRDGPMSIPYSWIGRLFQLSKGAVEVHWKNWKKRGSQPGKPGRIPSLSQDQLNIVIQYAIESFGQQKPKRIFDLTTFIMKKWQIAMRPDTLRHILARDGRTKSAVAHPMDDQRMMVSREKIIEYIDVLYGTVHNARAAFIFNMDEMGHQDWADAHDVICIVPTERDDSPLYYPVKRSGKRITLVACIAADGSYMKPTVILSRKTYETEVFERGLTKTNDQVSNKVVY
jgi:hypothetical protein